MSQTNSTQLNATQALARLRLRKAPRVVLSDYAAMLLKHSESPEREDLIRMMSLDPLMAVWILKRANSSYYGLRSTVDSLSRALDVLEESAIAGMFADTFGAEEASQEDLPSDSPDELTRHSVATAILSAQLECGDPSDRGPAFTAGLLHDIGKHIFSLNFPEEAKKMYSSSTLWESLQGSDLVSIEQLAFGVDHREVGEFLARKMQFPENLTAVLRHHADPSVLSENHESYRIAWIVNSASLAASAIGYAAANPVSWAYCESDPCWAKLIDESLVGRESTTALLADMTSEKETIDEFLDFEVKRSKTLMKSDSRPNRMNRDPVQSARVLDTTSENQSARLES